MGRHGASYRAGPSRTRDAYDRGEKKAIYERNGVTEYWLLDLNGRRLTRFVLEGERYDGGVVFHAEEFVESTVLPELRVAMSSLLASVL